MADVQGESVGDETTNVKLRLSMIKQVSMASLNNSFKANQIHLIVVIIIFLIGYRSVI